MTLDHACTDRQTDRRSQLEPSISLSVHAWTVFVRYQYQWEILDLGVESAPMWDNV